jgi:hypothetical protein
MVLIELLDSREQIILALLLFVKHKPPAAMKINQHTQTSTPRTKKIMDILNSISLFRVIVSSQNRLIHEVIQHIKPEEGTPIAVMQTFSAFYQGQFLSILCKKFAEMQAKLRM